MHHATMILEGGATRGVFTSGVLDYLMEKEFYTSHVIGVSAGSCNGVDYVSRQPGRTRDCMIHREKEYSYYQGVRRFLKDKSLLNMDMIFDRYPNEIYPFDYDTFFASNIKCEIVTTNCVTGKAEYMEEHSDRERLMRLCRASSSMPLVSPMVNIDGVPYLDGGVADSVPIRHALKSGNDKIIVVLTRNPGYRKKPEFIRQKRQSLQTPPFVFHIVDFRIAHRDQMSHTPCHDTVFCFQIAVAALCL